MLDKDIIRRRLDTGITYTEFSYMLLQSLDFKWLHENMGVDLQCAGSDQWGNITSGIITSGDKITIKSSTEEKTFIIVLKGDVNGDGKISAVDYVLIKNHIMNTNTLNSQELLFADVNKDGNVSAVDYVLIKNHIMEISNIVQ